ncbi:hypothetical protein [Lysobacter gummosus]|uniref:hypothetical protein n=1 Tax=Lysobacter gummosus TaxID=262324 RepID=UPI00363DF731
MPFELRNDSRARASPEVAAEGRTTGRATHASEQAPHRREINGSGVRRRTRACDPGPKRPGAVNGLPRAARDVPETASADLAADLACGGELHSTTLLFRLNDRCRQCAATIGGAARPVGTMRPAS